MGCQSLNSLGTLKNHLVSLARDRERRSIRHRTRHAREDRGIHHAKIVHALHPELRVDTGAPIPYGTHTTTAGRMVTECLVHERLMQVHLRVRRDNRVRQSRIVVRAHHELDAFSKSLQIRFRVLSEEMKVDLRGLPRILGAKSYGPRRIRSLHLHDRVPPHLWNWLSAGEARVKSRIAPADSAQVEEIGVVVPADTAAPEQEERAAG